MQIRDSQDKEIEGSSYEVLRDENEALRKEIQRLKLIAKAKISVAVDGVMIQYPPPFHGPKPPDETL